MSNDLHEANRLSWNAATVAHNSHKGDQAAFFRAGGSTLYPEEIDLLGDIAGLDLLHLQCNSGQDSLSLARLGANVTGVKGEDAGRVLADRITWFMRELKVPNGLKAVGYSTSDIGGLVEGTLPQHRVTKLSPRPASEDDLAKLFEDALVAY